MLNLEEVFEKHEDEFLQFARIEPKEFPTERSDLYAFLLLDRLIPGKSDMVAGAEHDEIYLETDLTQLADSATEEDIITLIRCGVRLGNYDSLCMFV